MILKIFSEETNAWIYCDQVLSLRVEKDNFDEFWGLILDKDTNGEDQLSVVSIKKNSNNTNRKNEEIDYSIYKDIFIPVDVELYNKEKVLNILKRKYKKFIPIKLITVYMENHSREPVNKIPFQNYGFTMAIERSNNKAFLLNQQGETIEKI